MSRLSATWPEMAEVWPDSRIVIEIADRINALRGNGAEEDSWLGVLKSVAPELAQAVTQILLARNGSAGGTAAAPHVKHQVKVEEILLGTEHHCIKVYRVDNQSTWIAFLTLVELED